MAPLRALVTGASSGIGRATARLVHAQGGSVALVARRADALDSLVADLGERAVAVTADVSDPLAAREAVQQAVAAFDGLDLVVNAAGVCYPVPLEALSSDIWSATIGINLSGTFWVSREAAAHLSAGGSIVNLGSEQSFIGMPGYVDYAASKFGVLGVTKAMAAELAPRGIRVNAVCPGPVDTPMVARELAAFANPEAARAEGIERVPLKRWASAEEIAEVILALGTTSFATGAAWSVDGGTTAI
jgi:3-oxoacyl-[acyl-carrier protein] reductase